MCSCPSTPMSRRQRALLQAATVAGLALLSACASVQQSARGFESPPLPQNEPLVKGPAVTTLVTPFDRALSCLDGRINKDSLRFAVGVNEVNAASLPATLDHLIDLEMAVSAGARAGAAYFMASPMLGRLKKLKDADGQPLWMPAAGDMPQAVNGYPVFVTEEIPTNLGIGLNETLVFFGNLRHLYVGERSLFAVKASEHVRFESDQTVFVGRERVAIHVVVPDAFARLVNVKVA